MSSDPLARQHWTPTDDLCDHGMSAHGDDGCIHCDCKVPGFRSGEPRPTAVEPEARHPLVDGYCPTCNGGCLVGFGNSNTEHEPHWGDHNDYACRFSGPHCWTCNEPWPCRASRGLAVEPDGLPLDTIHEFATTILSIVRRRMDERADPEDERAAIRWAAQEIARLTPTPAPPEARE